MTAQHRPATIQRNRDSIVALDMFSGAGGSSQGIEAAGIDVWYAANHWEYAINIHEANHPGAEHFIADLVDKEAKDYYHPEMLPAADVLWASPSCVHHSQANSKKAYMENRLVTEYDDPEYEERVTESERSRATAVCVLQYARKHRPKVIAVENVVEFAHWGFRKAGSSRGDGSAFRWWLKEFASLGYDHEILYLNSMFFGVPQSRDRMYVAFWDRSVPRPNLAHTPVGHCSHCDRQVQTIQTFRKATKAWPSARWGKYGKQYDYRCPSCSGVVEPFAPPAAMAIDWSDLGARIGDRPKPLAPGTMARIARGVEKYKDWPPFIVPCKTSFGSDSSVTEPLRTFTGQQDRMLVSAFQAIVAGNTFEWPGSEGCRARSLHEPLWTQHTTNAEAIISHPFIDNFQGAARSAIEVLPTQAGSETLGIAIPARHVGSRDGVIAPWIHVQRGTVDAHGELREARLQDLSEPLGTVSAAGNHQFLLSAIFAKQNGGPADTDWHHTAVDALGTMTGKDTTCLVSSGDEMPPINVDDCHYRMLKPGEIRDGMGFEHDYQMWGSARDQVKALGNAVTPPCATFVIDRLTEGLR